MEGLSLPQIRSIHLSINRSEAAHRSASNPSDPEVVAVKRRRVDFAIRQTPNLARLRSMQEARRTRHIVAQGTGLFLDADRLAQADGSSRPGIARRDPPRPEGQSGDGAEAARRADEPRDRATLPAIGAGERDHRRPKKTMHLARIADGRGTGVEGLMVAFAELRPQIGIAPACVALSINRAGIYRTRDRLARRHCAMFPRQRRPRPPLALRAAPSNPSRGAIKSIGLQENNCRIDRLIWHPGAVCEAPQRELNRTKTS
jgi:hypothetical protein